MNNVISFEASKTLRTNREDSVSSRVYGSHDNVSRNLIRAYHDQDTITLQHFAMEYAFDDYTELYQLLSDEVITRRDFIERIFQTTLDNLTV